MDPMEFPILMFVSSFVVLFLAAEGGGILRAKIRPLNEDQREDFRIVLGATLTLSGLLIGFSFSMAISRYDQRKLYEEAEANAIGTEYLRVGLLSGDTSKVRELLKAYLDQRICCFIQPATRAGLRKSMRIQPRCKASYGRPSNRAEKSLQQWLSWPLRA